MSVHASHGCVTLFRASVIEKKFHTFVSSICDCISLYVPLLHICNHYLRTYEHEKIDASDVYLHLF
jgi:hypothetical protein